MMFVFSDDDVKVFLIFLALWMQKLPIDQSMELLQAVLNYNTKDPLIFSCVLTNISALFPFAVRRPHFLPRILYKVRFPLIGFPIYNLLILWYQPRPVFKCLI